MLVEIPDDDRIAIFFCLDHFAKEELISLQQEINEVLEETYKLWQNKAAIRLMDRMNIKYNRESISIVLQREIFPDLLKDTYILVKRKDLEAKSAT